MTRAAREEKLTIAADNSDNATRLLRENAELRAELRRLKRQSASRGARDPLDERDAIIRNMRKHYNKSSAHGAAKALEKEWEDYLSRQWLHERELETLPKASDHRRDLHRISKLNKGAALSKRQLLNIFDGLRDS